MDPLILATYNVRVPCDKAPYDWASRRPRICKIIKDNKHHNILGVHMIGTYASEIIYGAAMMVETEMRVEDIQKLVFPHPTVCEVIRESMFL